MTKTLFHQNGYILFPVLAFAIPLFVRTIPELLMGNYLVGFDTIGYYAPNILMWLGHGVSFGALVSSAPLLYLLLMGITIAGAPLIITLKILGPTLLGLLGYASYFYANKGLSWSPKKSLIVAILSTLYFTALRVSWDMFRSELALIFLFLMLAIFQKNWRSNRNSVLLSLAMALVVFSHQLIGIIMFAIIIATTISFFIRKKKVELQRIIICSVPSAFLLLLIIYLNYFVFSSPVLGYSVNYSAGFEVLASASHLDLVINTFGFLVFCYLPLVPLLIFGFKHFKSNIHIKAWILWTFIILLLVVVSSSAFFLGGVLPFRWILLLTYPLSFIAVEGLFTLKWTRFRVSYKIIVGAIIAVLSISFMVLPNMSAINYLGAYPSYVPKSMLQNTIQFSDCQDTVNALLWAKNNMSSDGHLLVHEAFYGWALLSFDSNRLIPYFFSNLTDVVNSLQQNGSVNHAYLIWWVNGTGWYGQPSVPSVFTELFHSGNIAIYQYTTTNQTSNH